MYVYVYKCSNKSFVLLWPDTYNYSTRVRTHIAFSCFSIFPSSTYFQLQQLLFLQFQGPKAASFLTSENYESKAGL